MYMFPNIENLKKSKGSDKMTYKPTEYPRVGAGSRYGVKKIAEASTLEEIRKKARTKRREFSRRTGEWAQIMIDRDNMFHEML